MMNTTVVIVSCDVYFHSERTYDNVDILQRFKNKNVVRRIRASERNIDIFGHLRLFFWTGLHVMAAFVAERTKVDSFFDCLRSDYGSASLLVFPSVSGPIDGGEPLVELSQDRLE